MPSDAATAALYDIRDNILIAREFVTGLTFQDFIASRLHCYAVARAIEIISEASRRLTDDMRNRHPHLPWRAIRDTGNFYRHRYDNVAESRTWTTVHDDFPPLLAAVEQELQRL
jgi:uncharacterized protein with HEPN domain